MSDWHNFLDEKPDKAHRTRVLNAAKAELKKNEERFGIAWGRRWLALSGVTVAAAAAALLSPTVRRALEHSTENQNSPEDTALASVDFEMLDEVELLDDLELLEDFEVLEKWQEKDT